jgi:TolB-like protein/Tfp pilus assembly protein PilF
MAEREPSPTDATLLADEAGPATPAELPTTVLAGRYEILGLLGTGGMGRVYRAKDRELGEVVALKVLHKDLVGSAEMVERFRQEVRLARKVTHRNVARTFDIGEHDGEKFLTMELVAGEALSARLERELPPAEEVVAIAREILAGMGAAHAAGVVHRDLKPDNVLVESGGRVVVTDFGIARADAPGDAGRTSGRTVGTPAYMAPEQIGGQVTIDARADVYAFGAMLFEMLTGRRAWPGESALAVAAARLIEPPPDPRALRPSLSPKLGAIVLKCLARERDQRYASCAEIDRELAALGAADVVDAAGATAVAAPVRRSIPVPAEARERSVAVMPFRNLGPPDDAYFALGLTEDLVDALSTVRGLRVRGRGAAGASDQDVVEAGRRLGVDVVVDGSVRRGGDVLRVSARLVGVIDGFQIWSSRFERPAAGAFVLNDEVASAIATALSAERSEGPRPQPTDPRAIELYFRAKQAVAGFWELDRQEEAAELFRQALACAPGDPTILSGYVHAQLGRNVLAEMQEMEAAALVRRALVAGPKLPDPWVALAAVRLNTRDDAPGAIRALRRALELGPSSSDAHDRAGRLLLEANVWDEALAHLERAVWLDPSQSWARLDLVRAAALAGDWTKAQQICDSGSGPLWDGHRSIHQARIWSWTGAPESPLPVVKEGSRPELRAMVQAYRWARERRGLQGVPSRGEIEGPMGDLARALRPGRSRRFGNQMLAELAAIVGNQEAALEFVGTAVAEGLHDLAWMSRLNLLDPLRADPTFEAHRRTVEERAARVIAAWRASPESLDDALATLPAGA